MKNFITVNTLNCKNMRMNVNAIVSYWPIAGGTNTRITLTDKCYYDATDTVEEIDKKIEESMN